MAKATDLEKFKRIQTVAKWLVAGYSQTDIVHNITSNWGLKERQARIYIGKAFELFKEEALIDLEDSKAFHLRARMDAYQKLVKERDKVINNSGIGQYKRVQMTSMLTNQINALLRDMAKIDGHYISKHEHSGKNGEPIQFVVPTSLDELESDAIE